MSKKNFLNKGDYKKFKDKCAKIALICSTEKNKKLTKKLISKNEISCFFDFEYDQNESKIDINIFEKNASNKSKNFSGRQIEDGLQVENAAKEYYKQSFACFDLNLYAPKLAYKKTQEYLQTEKYDILFEPTFIYNDCIARCDILKRNKDGWEIIEVKANNDLKIEHLYDLVFQYYVLSHSGILINKIKIMHLNKEYLFVEDKINVEKLFSWSETVKKKNILSFAKKYCESKSNKMDHDINKLKEIILNDKIDVKNFILESNCNNGTKHEYCHHVIAHVPLNDTIFNLYRLHGYKKAKFYYDKAITNLKDIDLNQFYFHIFSKTQKRQIEFIQKINNDIIAKEEQEKILAILNEYQYPIYMYDFETFMSAIPKFKFSLPYQQVPFQYSIHILNDNKFDYKNPTTMYHFFYLEDGLVDPRINLVKNLVKDCFFANKGTYVAYNKYFEISIIKKLIEFVENDWNYKTNFFVDHKDIIKKLQYIKQHTIDLKDFFADFKIYKQEFNGSLSIKSTLPAFDENFSYKELKVHKGDMASEIFRRRVENNISLENWKKYYKENMIKYCNQDTLGMVVLFRKIIDLINDKLKEK